MDQRFEEMDSFIYIYLYINIVTNYYIYLHSTKTKMELHNLWFVDHVPVPKRNLLDAPVFRVRVFPDFPPL